MILFTHNIAKFSGIREQLQTYNLMPVLLPQELVEIQTRDTVQALHAKADQVRSFFSGNFVIDDASLELDAYPGFPGYMTKYILNSLGRDGLGKLIHDNPGATMHSHLAGYIDGEFFCVRGSVHGILDCSSPAVDSKMPLTTWFKSEHPSFAHRILAAKKLQNEIERRFNRIACQSDTECIFCSEFASPEQSIYKSICGESLPSNRILFGSDNFVVMPPLGEFVEGGLLLLTKKHLMSMAYLSQDQCCELSMLLDKISEISQNLYNKPILAFEHGPYTPASKSGCCVSHAHFNIFPITVDPSDELADVFHVQLDDLRQLPCLKDVGDYILVRYQDGRIICYFPKEAISQRVRKIVTRKLGFPERGHWLDYLGIENIQKTITDYTEYLAKDQKRKQSWYSTRDAKSIGQHWDSMAKYWDSFIRSHRLHYNRDSSFDIFSKLAHGFCLPTKDFLIVDVGCGTGEMLASMPTECLKYGLDVSKKMLECARQKQLPHATFCHHNLFDLSWPIPRPADLLTSRGILLSHYGFDNALSLLNALCHNLKKGGTALIDVLLDITDVASTTKQKYTFDQLRELAHEAGFTNITLAEQAKQLRSPILILRK